PFVILVFPQGAIFKFEGKDMNTKKRLSAYKRGMRKRINFVDVFIGHGVATYGDTFAVYHQGTAGSAVAPVIGIGVPQIEGKVILTPGIQVIGAHKVKPLGRLPIALSRFWGQVYLSKYRYCIRETVRIAFRLFAATFPAWNPL